MEDGSGKMFDKYRITGNMVKVTGMDDKLCIPNDIKFIP